MLLIDTSVRDKSNTSRVITCLEPYLKRLEPSCDTAALPDFAPFTGNYVTQAEGLPTANRTFIQKLTRHSDHLYLVPTYYKAMPGAFKNYLDLVQMRALYQGKRVGIISTNAKNQDYGARQFMQSLLGLLEFHKAVAVVVPQILILNPNAPDLQAFADYLDYFLAFPVPST